MNEEKLFFHPISIEKPTMAFGWGETVSGIEKQKQYWKIMKKTGTDFRTVSRLQHGSVILDQGWATLFVCRATLKGILNPWPV